VVTHGELRTSTPKSRRHWPGRFVRKVPPTLVTKVQGDRRVSVVIVMALLAASSFPLCADTTDIAHTTLGGRTPDEVYLSHRPANRSPRFEPRHRWPRGGPSARPWALVRGSPGARVELDIEYLDGKKHLPIVALRRAA